MRRWLPLVLAAVSVLAVVLVLALRDGASEQRVEIPPLQSPPIHGEDVTEVVVLLEETADPADLDRAVGLITDATRMWQGGLEGLADEGAEARELVVRSEWVAAGSEHRLTDAEIVFVVAADVDAGGGARLVLEDSAGTECAAYDDVFALGSWTARPGFDSHHRLPEGTFDQGCGGDGADVCLAVNGTFVAGGVTPMEAFGLVGDELGHCLGVAGA